LLKVGTMVADKYEIVKEIAPGGMSTVYLAIDSVLNKTWAVKVVEKKAINAADKAKVNAIRAEIEIMRKLDHPYIPQIISVDEDENNIFIVMTYIEGQSLNKVLEDNGPQNQYKVIEWAKQICDIFSYLHSFNPPIIYRDMKPSNVMLKPDGKISVLDFGIAREYKEGKIQDTILLGTESFAAPEQYKKEYKRQSDPRTDIYTLGATMYVLLTNESPSAAKPIREIDPSFEEGLEQIILKAMAFKMDERYQSAEDMLWDLEHYVEIGEPHRAILKKKMAWFLTPAILCVVMALTGTISLFLMSYENNQNYEKMIDISTATEYEEKINTYEKAIGIIGSDTRAYMKLLKAYEDNGTFGDSESNKFSALYNENKASFNAESIDVIDLNFEVGYLYFNLFSGSDNTTRTRMLKASPYFKYVVDSGRQDYERYYLAESYSIICNFYTNYVANSTGINEPTKEAYDDLLVSLEICINNLEDYESPEAAYVKLTMYNDLLNIIYSHRSAFANLDVSYDNLIKIVDLIKEKTEAVSVTQTVSVELQQNIINNYDSYVKAIDTAYENAKENG